MQFSVPQFVDVEDKIIGPLTLRQFLYILGGAGVMFLLYTFLTLPFFIILSIPIAGIAALFAFYKPNGRDFAIFVASIIGFLTRPRLYLWQRTPQNRHLDSGEVMQKKSAPVEGVPFKEVTESRLKKLAFVLDTAGGVEERQAIAENLRHTSTPTPPTDQPPTHVEENISNEV